MEVGSSISTNLTQQLSFLCVIWLSAILGADQFLVLLPWISAHKFKKAYHRGVTSDSCPSTIPLECIRKLVQPDMSKESSRYNVILYTIIVPTSSLMNKQ